MEPSIHGQVTDPSDKAASSLQHPGLQRKYTSQHRPPGTPPLHPLAPASPVRGQLVTNLMPCLCDQQGGKRFKEGKVRKREDKIMGMKKAKN